VFVAASSIAHHPNTVPRSAWMLAKLNSGAVSLEAWPDFEIYCDGPNTEEVCARARAHGTRLPARRSRRAIPQGPGWGVNHPTATGGCRIRILVISRPLQGRGGVLQD
jgi:hypothetical protein